MAEAFAAVAEAIADLFCKKTDRMTWHMIQRKGNDTARLSFAERRSVRRAIAKGRPVDDPRLRRYALRRIRFASQKFQGLQRRIPSRRRQIVNALIIIIIGLAVMTEAGPLRAFRVVVGAIMTGIGVMLLSFVPLAGRGSKRLVEGAARKEQVYKENSGDDQ